MTVKLKWTNIMKAFHSSGATNNEYGLIHNDSGINGTIGAEEYAIGDMIKKALEKLGIEIENDL